MTLLFLAVLLVVLFVAAAVVALCGGAARGDRALERINARRVADRHALDLVRSAERRADGDTDLAIQLGAQALAGAGIDHHDLELMLALRHDRPLPDVQWLTAGNLDAVREPTPDEVEDRLRGLR